MKPEFFSRLADPSPAGLRKRLLIPLLCVLGLQAGAGPVFAHELPDNRATLVLRDDNHISLSFQLDYAEALWRELAPELSEQEFHLTLSTLPPKQFEQQLNQAQNRFAEKTRVSVPGGSACTLQWFWPQPDVVKSRIQEEVMQSVVGGHEHPAPMELRAQCQAQGAGSGVSLTLPEAWGRVLVVSYRPKQVWTTPSSPTLIRF
jgi:hypothetical protein